VKYQHRFRVRAPLKAVAEFHSRAASMAAITPPPVIVRLHSAPDVLGSGGEMAFTLWLGPLPLHWRAQIENVSDAGFTDRLLTGPFKSWQHRHSYRSVGPGVTEVRDEVTAGLRGHVLWGPVGLLMWLGLPVLFAYRGWRTRRLLDPKAKE
jgi:ligand-binding SRPBCC domain-containing protein